MPFILPSDNLFQQKRASHHTRNSKRKIMTSLNVSSHQTLILNISQQRTILKHYQEHSDLILLKIPPYHHKKHQNHMSNQLLTYNKRGPAQEVPFLYTPSHLSELQSFKSIISTHFPLILIFKQCKTQFSHWIVSRAIFFYGSIENQLKVFCYVFLLF